MTGARVQRLLGGLSTVDPLVVASGNCATPRILLRFLDEIVPAYRLFMLNAPLGIPSRPGVNYVSPFVGPGMRDHARLGYVPCRLSLVPRLLKTHLIPDIVVLNTSRPRYGVVSLGVEVNVLPAAVEAVRANGGIVIAQLNAAMPFTGGADARLALDDLDAVVEVDEPLDVPVPRLLSDAHRSIGDRVAAVVSNGATLQVGIGAVPDAVLGQLLAHRQLRVWSEMISDGILALQRGGALADSAIITSFIAGSAELYDWVSDNPQIILTRTETTNDVAQIGKRRLMTAINTAMQVDLFGQASASHVPGHVHSGAGGQDDFVDGALRASDGRAILALPAWHERSDASTIVAKVTGPASSFQPSHVVTDIGIARVWGHTAQDQASELIEQAADPRARSDLWDAAIGAGAGTCARLVPIP